MACVGDELALAGERAVARSSIVSKVSASLTQLVTRPLQGAGQMTSTVTSDLAEFLADDWAEQDQKSV